MKLDQSVPGLYQLTTWDLLGGSVLILTVQLQTIATCYEHRGDDQPVLFSFNSATKVSTSQVSYVADVSGINLQMSHLLRYLGVDL